MGVNGDVSHHSRAASAVHLSAFEEVRPNGASKNYFGRLNSLHRCFVSCQHASQATITV